MATENKEKSGCGLLILIFLGAEIVLGVLSYLLNAIFPDFERIVEIAFVCITLFIIAILAINEVK